MKRKNSENANRTSVAIFLAVIIIGGICASIIALVSL